MTHESAWERLPDLLETKGDRELLAHIRSCHACQEQVFLLNRVDRLLREHRPPRRRRTLRPPVRRRLAAAAALVAAVGIALQTGATPRVSSLALHGAGGGPAVHGAVRAEAGGTVVSVVASGLPSRGAMTYLLWARDRAHPRPVLVGRLADDGTGTCRGRFRIRTLGDRARFWITSEGAPTTVLAST
jgi:hypothetical protein